MGSAGSYLATGSDDQTIKIWDYQTGDCLKTLKSHRDWVGALCFSPVCSAPSGVSELLLASGSHDQTIRLWDGYTGEPLQVLEGHTHRVENRCL